MNSDIKIKNIIQLISRSPDVPQQEVDRIKAIAHSLDIPSSDPMFSILVMMHTYSAISLEKNLGSGFVNLVATSVINAAEKTARKEALKYTLYAAFAVIMAFLFGGVFGVYGGYQYGTENGYRLSYDEKAAASWANTNEGKAAYELSKTTSLIDLKMCKGQGWKKYKKDGQVFCNTGFFEEDGKTIVNSWRIKQ